MSISHEIIIWCDNCSQWDHGADNATNLRKELRQQGWSRVGRCDYCPSCTEERKGKQDVRPSNR